jgi:hypothetical protein
MEENLKMKTLELQSKEYPEKMGQRCGDLKPNITEDTLFVEDGKAIGFYLKEPPIKLRQLLDVANAELNSSNVPKVKMDRGTRKMNAMRGIEVVQQYSATLGACVPRAHMKRDYGRTSQLHSVPTAKTFIKAMLLACREGEKLLKDIMPEQYEFQKQAIEENVPEKYRLTDLFSSSISNFNIAAAYHQDKGNLKGCVNFIFSKKENARGGHLHVPEYDAVIDNKDGSMLVYPAYKNMHGVTPIIPLTTDGYRNSLVFYAIDNLQKFF